MQGHLLPAPIPFLFPPGGGRSHDTPSSGRLVIGGTGRRSLTAFNFSSSESATCIPSGLLIGILQVNLDFNAFCRTQLWLALSPSV